MKQIPDFSENVKHRDPFVVPDGYFDSLADRVMLRVDTSSKQTAKRPSRVMRLIRWSAAACIVAVAGIGIGKLSGSSSVQPDNEENIPYYASIASDEEWDMAMDYAMVDNMDIAYLLTEAPL